MRETLIPWVSRQLSQPLFPSLHSLYETFLDADIILLTLKINLSFFLPVKMGLYGKADHCNLGQASYGKTIGRCGE